MNGVEYHDWIGALPPDVRDAVLRETEEMSVAVGAMLYERNTRAKGLFRLTQGRVRLFFLAECGREFLLKIYAPPESLGEIASIDGQMHAVFAEAQTNCTFQFLPREKLTFLRQKYPAIETALLDHMTRSVRTVLSLIEATAVFSMKARIAERLCFLVAEAEARGGPTGALEISQKDVSLMVGVSRQAVNKVLSYLQHLGILKTEYGAIIITDVKRLRKIADQSAVNETTSKT